MNSGQTEILRKINTEFRLNFSRFAACDETPFTSGGLGVGEGGGKGVGGKEEHFIQIGVVGTYRKPGVLRGFFGRGTFSE